MTRRKLMLLFSLTLLAACGGKETPAPTASADPAPAEAPPAVETPEATPSPKATAKLEPAAQPRPDEKPALPDGLYEGTLTGPREGTVRWKVVGGNIEEATATTGEQTFLLKGKISGRRITLGGKLEQDFFRLMGLGSEARMSGSWMAQFAGEDAQGSWSCERKIVAEVAP